MNVSKRGFLKNMGLAAAGVAAAAVPAAYAEADAKAGATSNSVFNVKDFGAKGDGKTPDTEAIQKALDAAGKVNGTAYFPAGKYLCHGLKAHAHTTLLAEPQWGYRGDSGAMLMLDTEDTDCMIDITGAFGVHIRGLHLVGMRNAKNKIHGIFLNNPKTWSKQEDSIVIDDTKVSNFSGHGVYLLRIWLFIIRHSIMQSNAQCGVCICGWDGFVTDNQLSGNALHGFACEGCGATVMFTANRVEWNHGYGLYINNGDAWNVTGNCFDCNWGAGFCARKIRTTTVSGNVFRRCGKSSSHVGAEHISAHVVLDECRGLSFVCNSCAAGKETDGSAPAPIVPEFGICVSKLDCTVVSCNTWNGGFLKEKVVDKGGNGKDYIFANNVGCKR